MKIKLNAVLVDDQDKALKFYTKVLGFIKKNDIPAGEARPIARNNQHHPRASAKGSASGPVTRPRHQYETYVPYVQFVLRSRPAATTVKK